MERVCTPQLDHSEMFTELYREEKREEGDRGGHEDKRGNQKGKGQASQLSIPYVLSTVCNTQRGSWSYIEKRRGRKETEVARRIKGENQKERDRSSQ